MNKIVKFIQSLEHCARLRSMSTAGDHNIRPPPLHNVVVVEMAGLAPGPFAGMVLADFGARVIRVDRHGDSNAQTHLSRGKRSVSLDLKSARGVDVLRRMCARADVLIDPFRPGVMEKLHVGPSELCALNPRLVYARLTGYGQTGPMADKAGHDINYVSISGVLSRLRRTHARPTPPVNLLADFAGGGLMCAMGILLALHERTASGRGQVIDCSMTEGCAYVSAFIHETLANPMLWPHVNEPGSNLLELQIDAGDALAQAFSTPTVLRDRLDALFKTKTRDEWMDELKDFDVCVTPVLDCDEVGEYAQNKSRNSFVRDTRTGRWLPRPAPLLMDSPAVQSDGRSGVKTGENSREILLEFGYTHTECDQLIHDSVVHEMVTKAKL